VSGCIDAFVCLVILLKKLVFDDEFMVYGSTITRPVLDSQDDTINDYNDIDLIVNTTFSQG
jgi:hypothetical protein